MTRPARPNAPNSPAWTATLPPRPRSKPRPSPWTAPLPVVTVQGKKV